MKEKSIPNNQRGAIAVTFAILSIVLIGFTAFGIDAGRLYLAKEKLKEAADAAALAGVQAYGFADWDELSTSVAQENFHDGYMGCSLSGIQISRGQSGPLTVDANISAVCNTSFARIFGIDDVTVADTSTAGRRPAEIMLVLDRSYSMRNSMTQLRSAANSLVNYFQGSQDVDKMGLISYATGVRVDFDLRNDFITEGITDAIKAIETATDERDGDTSTNMEDAIDQADDNKDRNDPANDVTTFTDQTGIPQNQRVKQFLVLFSDGQPYSFKHQFTFKGVMYDAVVPDPDNRYTWRANISEILCKDGGPWEVYAMGYLYHPYTGQSILINGTTGLRLMPTGDGKIKSQTACKYDCGSGDVPYETTKWHVFDDYPIDGYSSPYCNISNSDLRDYAGGTIYEEGVERLMTRDQANIIKAKGISIYCIGFAGTDLDSVFLRDISGCSAHPEEEYYYEAATSGELEAAFNHVAMEIKKYVYLQQ